MNEPVETLRGTLKNLDIQVQGPISQADLVKTFKSQLAKEFPAGVQLEASRITVTVDSVSMQVSRAK